MNRHLILISVVLLLTSATTAITQNEKVLHRRLSIQQQRLKKIVEQQRPQIEKVNQWFADEVDKLFYAKSPRYFRPFRLRHIDSFDWAQFSVNTNCPPEGTFIATGGYITESGEMTFAGYFTETSTPAVFAPKEFQFKPKSEFVQNLPPIQLRQFELSLRHLQFKRQQYLNRIETATHGKINNVKAAIKGIIAAPVKTEPCEIQAICVSGGIASAMIDNKLLYEGDKINGARITKIDKNSVCFQK